LVTRSGGDLSSTLGAEQIARVSLFSIPKVEHSTPRGVPVVATGKPNVDVILI
jgi:hypothetical protein